MLIDWMSRDDRIKRAGVNQVNVNHILFLSENLSLAVPLVTQFSRFILERDLQFWLAREKKKLQSKIEELRNSAILWNLWPKNFECLSGKHSNETCCLLGHRDYWTKNAFCWEFCLNCLRWYATADSPSTASSLLSISVLIPAINLSTFRNVWI